MGILTKSIGTHAEIDDRMSTVNFQWEQGSYRHNLTQVAGIAPERRDGSVPMLGLLVSLGIGGCIHFVLNQKSVQRPPVDPARLSGPRDITLVRLEQVVDIRTLEFLD